MKISLNDEYCNNDPLSEAICLMKNHFIRRHLYDEKVWNEWEIECRNIEDSNVAVREFMKKFNDPYSRFIEKGLMNLRQQSIRGKTVSAGLIVKRKFRFRNLKMILQGSLPSRIDIEQYEKLMIDKDGLLNRSVQDENMINLLLSKLSGIKQLIVKTGKVFCSSNNETQKIQFVNKIFSHLLNFMPAFAPVLILRLPLSSYYIPSKIAIYTSCSIIFLTQLIRRSYPLIYPLEVIKICDENLNENTNQLELGDIILSINDVPMTYCTANRVMHILDDGKVGDLVNITILRINSKNTHGNDNRTSIVQCETLAIDKGARYRNVEVKAAINTIQINNPLVIPKKMLIDKTRIRNMIKKKSTQSKAKPMKPPQYEFHRFVVTRDVYILRKVDHYLLPKHQGEGVGYILIREFTDETLKEVQDALSDLNIQAETQSCPTMENVGSKAGRLFAWMLHKKSITQNLKALIIDVRGNPGGPLSAALDVASIFLVRGTPLIQMVSCQDRDRTNKNKSNSHEKYFSTNRHADTKTPLLLLTDHESASASEILIEALCDNKRADSMGQCTVGKNVAQAIMGLSDGSGLCFSIKEFLSPTGRYMGDGHTPKQPIEGTIQVKDLVWDANAHKFVWQPNHTLSPFG